MRYRSGNIHQTLAASLTLAIMTLPVIITSTKEALAAVPKAFRARMAGQGGRKIVVGIRPERVFGPGETPPPGAIRLEGTVEMLETLGDEVIVHSKVCSDVIVLRVDPHLSPEMDSKIDISFSLESLHLFDAETEERIQSEGLD